MTTSVDFISRKRTSHPTEPLQSPFKITRTLSSSSSRTKPPPVDPELVRSFLGIQTFPLENPESLPDHKLSLRLLKHQTTYSNALQNLNPVQASTPSFKTTLREIYIQACIALHQSRGTPKFFSYRGLHYIAYKVKEAGAKISLFTWSGQLTEETLWRSHLFLGQGAYSIAQIIVEISTQKKFALKCLRQEHRRGAKLNLALRGIKEEKEILKHIARHHGQVKCLPSPPLLTIPTQPHPTQRHYSLAGAHIETPYEKNLFELEFSALSTELKLSLLKELAYILETINFLNTKLQFRGSGVIHGDIKPENILYKYEDGNFELCLIDFGLAATAEENYINWRSECNNEDWDPELYSLPFRSDDDLELLKKYLQDKDFPRFKSLLLSMEVYAFGGSLDFILLSPNFYERSYDLDDFDKKFVELLTELIEEMLEQDPEKRISAEDAACRLHGLVDLYTVI